jgi:cell division septum initiation protein DivIVA
VGTEQGTFNVFLDAEVRMNLQSQMSSQPQPSSVSARGIVRSDFSTVRKGFDPDEVVAHLGRVAEHVADLESKVSDLEKRLRDREAAVPAEEDAREEAYRSVASRVADIVRSFDEEMERARTAALSEADAILAEARADADRVSREAERVRTEAQRSADDIATALETRRAALLENVRRIRDGLTKTVESAESVLAAADEVPIRVDGVGSPGMPTP